MELHITTQVCLFTTFIILLVLFLQGIPLKSLFKKGKKKSKNSEEKKVELQELIDNRISQLPEKHTSRPSYFEAVDRKYSFG